MPSLSISFAVRLVQDDACGPQFHRWLPDGQSDALRLTTTDPAVMLSVWLERRGFMALGNMIHFDLKRREIEPTFIPQQGRLEAGNLYGSLSIDVTQETLTTLRENLLGDAHYVALARRIVSLVVQPINRLLDSLTNNFGQYWLPRLEAWDSRKVSLALYCSNTLSMKWREEGTTAWHDFIPNEPSATFSAPPIDWTQYLVREDWLRLGQVLMTGHEPSPAAQALGRAYRYASTGHLRVGLTEAITALELALGERLKIAMRGNATLELSLQAFWNLKVPSQLTVVATLLGTIPVVDIEASQRAIEYRNKIVHEGWDPDEHIVPDLTALLRTIGLVIGGLHFKFPSPPSGNIQYSAWAQE